MVALGLLLIISNVHPQESPPDVLTRVLREVGFTRSDLGYAPKGYWNRFPRNIPYQLPAFKDLFREPLKLIDYSSVMANAVEKYLQHQPDPEGKRLYQLLYNLGVDRRQPTFRPYDPQLRTEKISLKEALSYLEKQSPSSLGLVQHWRRGQFIKLLETWPDTVQNSLALFFYHLGEVLHWRQLAFRNVSLQLVEKLYSIRDLAQTQADGVKYYPEFDDLATRLDWPSLWYAALKAAAAAERLEASLAPFLSQIPPGKPLQLRTGAGLILLLPPASRPVPISLENCLAVIDFGNDNRYLGAPGATNGPGNPISLLVDLGGSDTYGEFGQQLPAGGVGIAGVGVVIDHAGNDHYYGGVYAQGSALFGAGILLDRSGNDTYRAKFSAQGCGYFGIGLCLDVDGNDEYYLYGDGQGMGGIGGGVGVCASRGGNDIYRAEPDPAIAGMGDYHSQGKINANMVQGAGGGRRGDITDGHSWAGGLGVLVDISGNDEYESGNWSQGVAYWFATGMLIDRDGDDLYRSCYFTQASGAHYCNALLLDEAGNDRHKLYETAGAALAFGWDFTNALLVDLAGDDRYEAKIISLGLAQIRSNALFIELGGNDTYILNKGTPGLGEASFRASYRPPAELTTYYTYAKSFGGFIEIGGDDLYFQRDSTGLQPLKLNNSLWLKPERNSSEFGAENFGVGLDTTAGVVMEILQRPRLAPKR